MNKWGRAFASWKYRRLANASSLAFQALDWVTQRQQKLEQRLGTERTLPAPSHDEHEIDFSQLSWPPPEAGPFTRLENLMPNGYRLESITDEDMHLMVRELTDTPDLGKDASVLQFPPRRPECA
jgi:hypothetical protein